MDTCEDWNLTKLDVENAETILYGDSNGTKRYAISRSRENRVQVKSCQPVL